MLTWVSCLPPSRCRAQVASLLGEAPHIAMVAVDVGAEFAPVWGTAPFYRTASPQAAVDNLLLLHTRWGAWEV